jgi:hypothetical protein
MRGENGKRSPSFRGMNLDLSDAETADLLRELDRIVVSPGKPIPDKNIRLVASG